MLLGASVLVLSQTSHQRITESGSPIRLKCKERSRYVHVGDPFIANTTGVSIFFNCKLYLTIFFTRQPMLVLFFLLPISHLAGNCFPSGLVYFIFFFKTELGTSLLPRAHARFTGLETSMSALKYAEHCPRLQASM